MVPTQGSTAGQVVRRIVVVAAVLGGLVIGYTWATQGTVFDLSDTISAVTQLAMRLPSGG